MSVQRGDWFSVGIGLYVKKYLKDGFTIDADEAVYDDGSHYVVSEIEKTAKNETETGKILEEIRKFALSQGIELGETKTKVEIFLERYNPSHFQALVKAGIY